MGINLGSRLNKIEQRAGVIEDCPMCAARATRPPEERDASLRTVQSWTYEVSCPQCGRPFAIQVNHVERAQLEKQDKGKR